MEELIKEFLLQKRFAVVGASDNINKNGYKILKKLIAKGYEVYPVNPRIKEIEGLKCYPSLTDIPIKIDVVDIVTPPEVTEKIVEECKTMEIKRVWLQPGAESEKAVDFCNKNDIKIVYNTCIMLR